VCLTYDDHLASRQSQIVDVPSSDVNLHVGSSPKDSPTQPQKDRRAPHV
jgi:hypothetical protein